MAQIFNLQPRRERLRSDQEHALRQAMLPFEDDIPGDIFRGLISQIDRASAARNKWTFIMLSPEQNHLVIEHLAANSKRPIMALRAWGLCFNHMRNDTGEILLYREELAEKLGTDAENVSRVMTELVNFGAIIRRREPRQGVRGPGMVHYFMNPKVATHLAGVERDKAQNDAPLLRLIETASQPS